MSVYSTGTQAQFNPVTGDEYFICNGCNEINTISRARKKSEKKVRWEVETARNVKTVFKVLAASLDMTYEETLMYLLHLHDKEKKGQIQDINIAGGFYNKEENKK